MKKEINGNLDDLFSVIILTYNNSQYLQGCIDSVLMQTYPAIEIIIADDCSDNFDCDGFALYCHQRSGENIKNIQVYKNEKNLGTVMNLNRAIERSNGCYIKLIGGDDQLANEFSLANAYLSIKKSPDGIITGDVIKCTPTLEEIGIYSNRLLGKINNLSTQEIFARLCVHNDIAAGGVFFSHEFIKRFGPFDENYRFLEDWPMWLKVFSQGARITYAPFDAIKYRTNVGFATSVNTRYLEDKKRVLSSVIIPNKKKLGKKNYLKARISFLIRNSTFVRRIYGLFVGREK